MSPKSVNQACAVSQTKNPSQTGGAGRVGFYLKANDFLSHVEHLPHPVVCPAPPPSQKVKSNNLLRKHNPFYASLVSIREPNAVCQHVLAFIR